MIDISSAIPDGRQRKPELAALTHLARDADCPSLSFYQLPGDSESQPSPAVLAGSRFVGAPEAIKSEHRLVGGDRPLRV